MSFLFLSVFLFSLFFFLFSFSFYFIYSFALLIWLDAVAAAGLTPLTPWCTFIIYICFSNSSRVCCHSMKTNIESRHMPGSSRCWNRLIILNITQVEWKEIFSRFWVFRSCCIRCANGPGCMYIYMNSETTHIDRLKSRMTSCWKSKVQGKIKLEASGRWYRSFNDFEQCCQRMCF